MNHTIETLKPGTREMHKPQDIGSQVSDTMARFPASGISGIEPAQQLVVLDKTAKAIGILEYLNVAGLLQLDTISSTRLLVLIEELTNIL